MELYAWTLSPFRSDDVVASFAKTAREARDLSIERGKPFRGGQNSAHEFVSSPRWRSEEAILWQRGMATTWLKVSFGLSTRPVCDGRTIVARLSTVKSWTCYPRSRAQSFAGSRVTYLEDRLRRKNEGGVGEPTPPHLCSESV